MSAIVPEARYRDYLMPLVQGFVDIATTADGSVTCDYPVDVIGLRDGRVTRVTRIACTNEEVPRPG